MPMIEGEIKSSKKERNIKGKKKREGENLTFNLL
jgi:hypothetical protein